MSYYQEYQTTSFASLLANAQSPQQQGQMAPSMPQQIATIDSLSPQGAQEQSPSSLYATSLPSSTASSVGYQSFGVSSPQSSLSSTSIYSTSRARFLCSKGFELEDDLEFCPDIVNFASYTHAPPTPTSKSILASVYGGAGTSPIAGSSQSSPNAASSPRMKTLSIPRVRTPRVRKALDIVNPHTGMRVESRTMPRS